MTAALEPLDLSRGGILGDQVYESIATAILTGRLAAGQRMRDVDLAAELGVSRTPVREALQRLERIGLVEIAVGRYTRVSTPDDELRQHTAEFTAYFMGNALRLALAHGTDAEVAGILEACDRVIEASKTGDGVVLFETSTLMFMEITRATHNRLFLGVIREAQHAIARNLHGWDPFMREPLLRTEGYVRLREAIAARDGDTAEATLRYLHALV